MNLARKIVSKRLASFRSKNVNYYTSKSSEKDVMSHSSTFLLQGTTSPSNPYALIVANQSLPRFTPLLWNNSILRVGADGGANQIYDGMPRFFPLEDPSHVRLRYKLDVIKGDMDSVRPEVLDYYASLGTKIIDQSQDQDTTDLHKCVSHIRNESDISDVNILVTGGLGGRFDHEAASINTLHSFSDTKVILLSNDSIVKLLPKSHRHEIHVQSAVEGPYCGLIPFGMPSLSTSTTGLNWNLNKSAMKFGGLVSTSNFVLEDTIAVESDSDLVWTICIKKSVD